MAYLKRLPLFVDGQAIEEYNNLEVNGEANPIEITTVLKGLAGKSDGNSRVTVSCTSAMPIGGPEYDYWNAMIDGREDVTMQIGVGDGDFVSIGWFTSVRFSASTDKACEVQWEWTGPPGRIE